MLMPFSSLNYPTRITIEEVRAPVDVAALQRQIAQSDPRQLSRLCELYRGELLQSVQVDGEELLVMKEDDLFAVVAK